MGNHTVFIFGLGYTGRALGLHLLAQGWTVLGTCRAREKQSALLSDGFHTLCFNGHNPTTEISEALQHSSHILSTVPHSPDGDPVLNCFADTLSRGKPPKWIGYLSTTGVYGNREGGWVDEDTPPVPTTDRGRQRLQAEEAWRDLHSKFNLPVHVFRLVGIYGPGRNTLLRVQEGKARRIEQPGQIFSRIHLEDVVAVLAASMQKPHPGRIYNVSDDHPTPPAEVIEYACSLLQIDPPPWTSLEESGMSDLGRSFYLDRKRVSNRRIKEELKVALQYPDYRSGLDALFRELHSQ